MRWFANALGRGAVPIPSAARTQAPTWTAPKNEASAAAITRANARHDAPAIFGNDVSHRMVDFAKRNARRAGVVVIPTSVEIGYCSNPQIFGITLIGVDLIANEY